MIKTPTNLLALALFFVATSAVRAADPAAPLAPATPEPIPALANRPDVLGEQLLGGRYSNPLAGIAFGTPANCVQVKAAGGDQIARFTNEKAGWDVDTLVQRAANVYLEMIFRDGLYHADPHPGNFLIPDATHLAILDFGDVGRVTEARRLQLENLVISIGTHDIDALIDVVVEMTSPPPETDMRALRADIESWVNRYLLVASAL